MPSYIPCHCLDTVKHILLDFVDLPDTKIKCNRNVKKLKDLFNDNKKGYVIF